MPPAIPRKLLSVRGAGVRFVNGPLSPDSVGVSTTDNTKYATDVTLGGLNLTLILDTGSSDLVVVRQGRNINLVNTSNVPVNETFGIGSAAGNVAFADLQIGDFTVHSQAFVDATQTIDFNEGQDGFDGIIGVSFNAPSAVIEALSKEFDADAAAQLGNTPLPALFTQQPDLPDSFDVLLGRADELGDAAPGTFLIGGHDDNFRDIAGATELVSVSTDHWSVVMDAMNINGKPFPFNASRVQGVPAGKVAAVLDTGFSFPPIPPAAVDAIYSSIEGAVFDETTTFWIVPCNSSGVSLSFVFGDQEFFVHPLDLTLPVAGPFNGPGGGNVTICINTFQYLTLDPAEFVGFDLILGDAFLRNVYASFNYGDQNTPPFVQMVTTTPDADTAQQEFQQQRAKTLAGLPPTIDPAAAANQGGQSPAAGAPGVPGSSASARATSSAGPSSSATQTVQNAQPTASNNKNGAGRARALWTGVYGAYVLYLVSGVFLL
ncbi:acid protease [Trametes versicolor FP-101664 SS1]|uniref:acid protease n=1 Tax=Trametes versicolor (strain FP-101664) TaxID=717944 RepID=UPI0004621A9E|nr:acid protease [Trametes versicolor FP-101664 SS1]EIW59870.1 acid protease [Trametes versicolor FP-101664 SS1]